MTDQAVQDFLAHFGVKGMKWGVRRERMPESTQTRAERKEVRKHFGKFATQVVEKKYAPDENPFDIRRGAISDADYKKLSNKDLVVRKGTTIRRVTSRADETFAKDEVTFVSYKLGDQTVYRAVIPSIGLFKFGGNKRYKNSYEATFKATETLKSPSEKARVDAFAELLDTGTIKTRSGKEITSREYLKRSGYGKQVKTLDRTRLGQEFYKSFTMYQGDKSEPLNTAYFEKLRKKGYNALVDDNDRGHLADTPLILLNPNGSIKRMSVKQLTADDVNKAMSELKLDPDEKPVGK